MKIRVEDIKESEKELAFVQEVVEMNQALSAGGVTDYQFPRGVPVALAYYRLGADLLFRGHFSAEVAGTCARCLESYPFSMREPFLFVLKPATDAKADPELSPEDLVESFYQGPEVDLSPHLREAALLALPTRPLCREDCEGLCPRCGANLNAGRCGCPEEQTDPRRSALRAMKRDVL